ncbi:MAG TPA: hypothetical protein VGB46_12705 [Flavisolibacter sp.]|jgi:hypothetical protein
MHSEQSIQKRPNLTRLAFWDTDLAALDLDKYADFTIHRVLQRGNQQDIAEIILYYGKDKIRTAIRSSTSLQPREIILAKQVFGLSEKDFECLKHSPLHPVFSKY